MRNRIWVAYLAAALVATAAYVTTSSPGVKTALVIALAGGAAVAIAVALRTYRPRLALGWVCLGLMQLVWAIGWAFGQRTILATDAPPGVDSWQNILFLCSNPLLLVALALLLRRVDPDPVALIDVAIIAAASLTFLWPTLIHAYFHNDEVSALGKAVQATYAVVDIAIFSVAVRVATAGRHLAAARVLLIACAAGLLFSDVTWNWTTQLGDYAPGSWGDAGWMLMHAAAGTAALHPSMRSAYAPEPRTERRLRWRRLVPLAIAAVVAPGVLVTTESVFDHPVAALPAAVAAATLTLLVLGRMVLVLREEEGLARRLNAQNEQLLALDRLKDDFVASVSHELRTPLTSIRGYLELVLDEETGTLADEQRRFLAVVDRNSERLLRVVSDLLFVAQVGAGKLALETGDVDLARVAVDTVESARPSAAAKHIELVADIAPIPTFRGDESRLAQLLDNLVSNAIKFTNPGGRVDVRARADGVSATIEVADTGIGIAREDQSRVFNRFFRASTAIESAIQGTGLGLAIAKAIADAHGGTVDVESERDRGTTFRVQLPLSVRSEASKLVGALP